MLHTVTRALGALEDLRSEPSGRIVIGLPSRVARVLTTSLVTSFRGAFPHAAITIAEGLSSVLHEWLLLGRVDVALLVDPPRSADLDLELLHSEELVLVGPSNSRLGRQKSISLEQIEKYPLIVPRIPNATRAVLEAAVGRVKGHLNISAEVDTTQNILELVAGKIGYAVLPRGAVANAGDGRFRVVGIRPAVRQHLFLALSKRRPRNQLTGKLQHLVRQADLPRLLG